MTKIEKQQSLAKRFFQQWSECSIEILKILAPKCPPTPGDKTRPWSDEEGPQGLLVHYNGGPNGVASIRWSNENTQNTKSSWHCTVFDHKISDVEDIRQAFPMMAKYMPITAILHADRQYGTWHGNHTNSMTWGLENRNLGLLTESGGQIYRAAGNKCYYCKDGKDPVKIHGRYWEPYTVEQLIANINIGRMLRYWRQDKFQPGWVIPHQLIRGGKSDTGSAYPMGAIREAIFSDIPPEDMNWLKGYLHASKVPFPEDDDAFDYDLDRSDDELEDISNEPMAAVEFDNLAGSEWRDYLPAVRRNMSILGGYCPDPGIDIGEYELDDNLRLATNHFQKSTHDPKYSGKKLKVDGVPGQATRDELDRRLRWFGHNV